MQMGNVIHDFELLSITPLQEMDAEMYMFCHRKTGAELMWLKRPDHNKTFCVTFKTLPENDTGVFHIMEHSVLCGSEKYPVKQPFVELMKGSMNTFLNAFTFPDKTMYPVSSRNDADFRNLVSVYLDAVFHPAVYVQKNIFLQEGWRLEQEEGAPGYVGVVFNEMKGALSSVDELMAYGMGRMLFPDNCYRFESGGDPEHIPELTYDAFLNAHRRFYHPSNARFFLDGEVNLEQVLEMIDGEYLCHYERREPDFALLPQAPVVGQVKTTCYELAPGEEKAGKACCMMSKIIGSWEDRVRLMAAHVLGDYLTGSNDAPLKRALLEKGLAEEIQLTVEDGGVQQVTADLVLKNMREENLPRARETVQAAVRGLLAKGLDRDELTGCLNRYEFSIREHNEPYGIMLAIQVMNSWLYGGDPALYLRHDEAFAALRAHLNDGYFEQLLREMLLEDETMCELHALPSETLGAEQNAAEKQRAKALWEAMNEEARAAHGQELDALHAWQQTPDSQEKLNMIPHLSLEEVTPEPFWTPLREETIDGVKVLRSPVNAGGMVYLKLYFAINDLTLEELSSAKLLSRVLGELPTREHTSQEVQRAIKLHLGSLTHRMDAFTLEGKPGSCRAFFTVSCSVLESKVEEAIRLIREVQLETQLRMPERIRELVQQAYMAAQQQLIMNGMMAAMQHAQSSWSAASLVQDVTSGYGEFAFLRDLKDHFDERIEAQMDAMERLCRRISVSDRLMLGVTGRVSDEQVRQLAEAFPAGEKAPGSMQPKLAAKQNTAIVISAPISFACMGANVEALGCRIGGADWVLGQLISLNYLWNEVRVQGGAYGCGFLLRDNGNLSFYSFRDPNPARTLAVYRKAAEFVRGFCEGKGELSGIIIGTLSERTPLLAPRFQSERAFSCYLSGVTEARLQQINQEILNTSHDDLLAASVLLEKLAEQGTACVVGSAEMLDACEGLVRLA